MQAGDLVTISPPFGDGLTEFVVSGALDEATSYVEQGGTHLAYGNSLLTKVGEGGSYSSPPRGIRRLTKLQFVERLGSDFDALFAAAKVNLQVEKFMKLLEWATPDPDGTSVDLDDPRVIGALQAFAAAGLLTEARAQEILA